MRNETSTLILFDGGSETYDKIMDLISSKSENGKTTTVFIDATDSNVAKVMLNESGDTVEEPINGVGDILNVIGTQMDKGNIIVVAMAPKASLPAITLRANMTWAHVDISP